MLTKNPKLFHVQEKLWQMYKTADIQGKHQTYFISTEKLPEQGTASRNRL